MVFWKRYINKIKSIISRTEFDSLKEQVNANTTNISDKASLTNQNIFRANQYFQNPVGFTSSAGPTTMSYSLKSTDSGTSLVNKRYLDNNFANLSKDNQFHNTNYFNGTTHLEQTNCTNLTLTTGTISNDPVNDIDIVNKKYVDAKGGSNIISLNLTDIVESTIGESSDNAISFIIKKDYYDQIVDKTFIGFYAKYLNSSGILYIQNGTNLNLFDTSGSTIPTTYSTLIIVEVGGTISIQLTFWKFDESNKQHYSVDLTKYSQFKIFFA